jgi:class 3 adenylate cyclase
MSVRYRFASLEDFLISTVATVDGQLDDGWGASFPVKGREIQATILFADITAFSARTAALSPAETLVFVNNFLAWISAEAPRGGAAIVDKYIGDEIMLVFSKEFGSVDPFSDALAAARRMREHDALEFCPHIGIAAGPVIVGYVGTPIRYSCSVFGRPVALAARCAQVRPAGSTPSSASIAFPATEWAGRDFATQFPAETVRMPDGTVQEMNVTWEMKPCRTVDLKNVGSIEVIEIVDNAIRTAASSGEDRARAGIQTLRNLGRYWPAT